MAATVVPLDTDLLYPSSAPKLEQLGELAADLLDLGRGPEWILRRKEKVTLLDDSVVRRQMSVDFALPSFVRPMDEIHNNPVYYAPLFFLPKGLDEPFDPDSPLQAPEPHFANFDLRDGTGRALSLPARKWNGLVTSELLRSFIERVLERTGKSDPRAIPGIAAISRELCESDHHKAELWLEDLRSNEGLKTSPAARRLVHEADRDDPSLARMLEVCAVSSVAMTPLVSSEACQDIIKLSFDEQVTDISSERRRFRAPLAALGWAGYELWVETPYVGAASYHFEFQAPDGLEIYDAGLVRVDGPTRSHHNEDPTSTTRDRCSGFASRLHLYERSAAGSLKTFAWIRLRIRRQEFVTGAMVAGIFVAVTMWGAWFVASLAAESPSNVPTLLLLVPSVIAAYAARPSPHLLTTRMLRNARWVVASSAVLPFIAAASLALMPRQGDHVDGHTFEWIWLGSAIVSTLLAIVLLGARLFPLPERTAHRLKERVTKHLVLDVPAREEPWVQHWRRGRLGKLARRLGRRKSGN